jgi:hypothetical protein
MRCLLVATLCWLAGCACGDDRVVQAYAPQASYRAEIDDCIVKHACDRLCMQLFRLTDQQRLTTCSIHFVDAKGGASVRAEVMDYSVCGAGGGGWIYDDPSGGDDGSWDDGSGDDGSDTGDDGSGDDGSDTGDDGSDTGDDGSGDDGSGDDGSSELRAPDSRLHPLTSSAHD